MHVYLTLDRKSVKKKKEDQNEKLTILTLLFLEDLVLQV